jgi:hypothetical protein
MTTRNTYLQWVQEDLRALAAAKFPGNPDQQVLYQLGFLQRMFADAMWDDSKISNGFARSLRAAANREQTMGQHI